MIYWFDANENKLTVESKIKQNAIYG